VFSWRKKGKIGFIFFGVFLLFFILGNSSDYLFDKLFELKKKVVLTGTEVSPLFSIGGIFVSGGKVYISDFDGHRVSVYTTEGRLLRSFGGVGKGPGEFQNPSDIAVDKKGYIYVNDVGNLRIQIFDSLFKFVRSFGLRNSVEKIMVSGDEIICVNVAPVPCAGDGQEGRCILSKYGGDGKFIRNFGIYNKQILVHSWVSAMDKRGLIYLANVLGSDLYVFDRGGVLNQVISIKSPSVVETGVDIEGEAKSTGDLLRLVNILKTRKHTRIQSIFVRDDLIFVVHALYEKNEVKGYFMDVFNLNGRLIYSKINVPGQALKTDDEYVYFLTNQNLDEFGKIEIGCYKLSIKK